MFKYFSLLFIFLFVCCAGPPKQIDFPIGEGEFPQPKEKKIRMPLAVKATWAASPKGKPDKPRVLKTNLIPYTGPVFDFQPCHDLLMPLDSSLLRIEDLPSIPMDLDKFPAKKIKPKIILLGKPKKVKAQIPVAETQFTNGLLEFGQDQGLPGTSVYAMVKDKQGRLWLATDNGLCFYDGEFIYTWLKKDGLSSETKLSLCIDKRGHVWACGRGVDELIPEEGIIRHYGKKEGLVSNGVSSVMEDSKGNICLTNGGGFEIYNPLTGNLVHIGKSEGLSTDYINTMTEDHDGRYWLASNGGGVNIYDPAQKKLFILKEEQKLSNNDIRAILCDKSGNIWMGGWYGGVDMYNFKSGIFYHLGVQHGLAFKYIHHLIQDHNGLIWIAYLNGGVDTYNPVYKKLRHIYGQPDIAKSTVYCLLEDKENCIWMGCNAASIIKYDPSGGDLVNYNNKFWSTKRSIIAMLEDDEKNIWLSSSGEGMDIYTPSTKKLVHVNAHQDWTDAWQNQMIDDHHGHVFMCTQYRFDIYNKKTGDLSSWDEKQGLISDGIQCLLLGDNGVMMGTKNGVNKYDTVSSSFLHLDAPQYQLKDPVTCMEKDKEGRVWIGTFGAGLFMYDPKNSTLSHFAKAQGIKNNSIYCLLADHQNNIWVGVGGDGLKKIDTHINTVTTITTDEGLSEMTVLSLIEKDNKIYAGTAKGLSVIDESHRKITISNYGKAQGFRTSDFNPRSALVTSNGDILWGVGEVLNSYRPAANKNAVPSTAAIIGIDIMGKEMDFSSYKKLDNGINNTDTIWTSARDTFYFKTNLKADTGYIQKNKITFKEINGAYHLPQNLELPYDQDHVTFHYTGTHLNNTDKTSYRYILEGQENKWNVAVSESFADYRNLQPGNYTFKVCSSNFGGPWSAPAEMSFTITPPIWKTTIAYVFYGLLFVASIIMYNRANTVRLRKRQKVLESVVKERTAEIVDQKNEIELQKQTVEEKQKEIVDSINYAKRIQYTLLAHEKVLKKHFSEHFVLFQPKDIVSGDFYWATKKVISEGKELFYLAVCDSTGHGVPGAFMSLLNINFLNEAINEKNILEPDAILNYVRESLIKSISRDGGQDGMDGILFCFETEQSPGTKELEIKKITYSAGNNKPLIYSNGKLTELSCNKMPIGKGERTEPFTLHAIDYQKGDIIYLYTDGFADQFGGPKGKKFKYRQLNELLLANANEPMEAQSQILLKAVNAWKGSLEQIDDICVMGIKL